MVGNRFQVRHGVETPTTDNLLAYELGWSTSDKQLYIYDAEAGIREIGGGGGGGSTTYIGSLSMSISGANMIFGVSDSSIVFSYSASGSYGGIFMVS